MKVTVLDSPQIHVAKNPHEEGTISLAIVFPKIRVRFNVPKEEVQAIFDSMAKSAFQVVQLWNKEEGEIVKDINSGG